MALQRYVELPAPPARVGGLLAAALPLPAGWERGVTFPTTGCIGPWVVGECPDTPDLKPTDRPGSATFDPVAIGAGLECSTLATPGGIDAAPVLDATAEWALAREFATGAASARDAATVGGGNPSMAGSVTENLGDAADPTEAIACLEQAAAAAMWGRPVWLHTSPAGGTWLYDAGVLVRDGQRWRTVAGSTVVVSPGYVGVGVPDLVATIPIFATGPVWAGLGQRDALASINREDNTSESRVEDIALALFDPCYVGVVGTGVEPCTIAVP